MKSFTHRKNRAKKLGLQTIKFVLDTACFLTAVVVAYALRFDFAIPASSVGSMFLAAGIWGVSKMVVFQLFKLERGGWQYTSSHDAVRVVTANALGSLGGALVIVDVMGARGMLRSIYALEFLFASLLTLAVRFATRAVLTNGWWSATEGARTRTVIYGAGAAGLALVWELRQNQSLQMEVVGLIDDDHSKLHLILQGKRVLGTGENLAEVVRAHKVKRVLIAVPTASGPEMARILKFAVEAGVEYKTIPGLGDLIQGADLGKQIRDVAVEDLLGRRPVELDQNLIRDRIQGKVVMVTGAAGSIGSELCRQIARFKPLALVGYDIAETPLFHIERELKRSFPELVFHAEIGDVTRPEMLNRVLHTYQPSIVYHAAAYKHVPMMEKHIFSAVENNLFGTWQLALAAVRHGVDFFVLISTDKAVRPTSMMGATKRAAEMVIRGMQRERGTKFVAVRFGNVLGSNGSVVPIFKEQIAAGGPLTVTHPEVTRYFMTIQEAAQLVLQAFSFGKGGEVFVLDMGAPVKIVNLARNLILLSGLQPDRDIRIEFTGLRPGEKLYEELNLDEELVVPTRHDQIKSYKCLGGLDAREVKDCIQELRTFVQEQDSAGLVLLLKQMIPDYSPGTGLLMEILQSKGQLDNELGSGERMLV